MGARDLEDAEVWWERLEPQRKIQLHRWIETPQKLGQIPGQMELEITERSK
ncbi:hypothetical protein HMPREF3227_02504 [Corynebacterium sp. CMW7794]|nr:hypothetical protein HMPREF3227_02504 [Corynebacterium sp. CMW7794]